MKAILPHQITDRTVSVPGSKSYTHRALIAAALSDGACRVTGMLDSEDTRLTRAALKQMGVSSRPDGPDLIIQGRGGRLDPVSAPIELGNSGTSMRLLAAVAALGQGRYVLQGSARMAQRPMGDLLDALNQIGVPARSLATNGCPPVEIIGDHAVGGPVRIDCHLSSQFLSALLLIAPCCRKTVDIEVVRGPVSRPYVDLTCAIMEHCGIRLSRDGYTRFTIPGGQRYRAAEIQVETDCSQASYFWAAAAVTGGRVKVRGIGRHSLQGDLGLVRILERMGCRVDFEDDGVAVKGEPLSAVEVDMADMPDVVPTLAVVAAFAAGTTIITGVGHLREKETDRLAAVATELNRMGIRAETGEDWLRIAGGCPASASIETYDDHRMAMSFAVAGLKTEGVVIRHPEVVGKSFPLFWQVFNKLYRNDNLDSFFDAGFKLL
ncbi:MAG: 3-phosphoshikimate 1-carboxyvinyltransferase [Desulfobacteraceae bacterium]|nr:3-phosphoshikimate 1-carboxyvinyltransferase [Desulfobacteraceae bacterium]